MIIERFDRPLWARSLVALGFASSSLACPSPSSIPHEVALPGPRPASTPLADQAKAELDQGHWERAAGLYDDLAEASGNNVHDRVSAEAREGACFSALNLPASALSLYEDVIANAEDARDALTSVQSVVRMSLVPEGERARILAELKESVREGVVGKLETEDASRLHYLLGVGLRAERKHADAIRELSLVNGADAGRAQILAAIIHVNERHSVPAAQALGKAREVAGQMKDPDEARRIEDLSSLLEGDVYYSAAMKWKTPSSKKITVDSAKLSEAVKLWKRVSAASELGNDARWQSAWATFTVGDYPTTRASLETALSVTNAYLPEAELLRATAEWAAKDDAKAKAHLEAFIPRYASLVESLRALQHELDVAPDSPKGLVRLTLRPNEAAIGPDVARAAIHATRDKLLRTEAQWLEEIDSEAARLAKPAEAMGHAGDRAKDTTAAMATKARLQFRALAGDRLLRESDELESLVNAAKGALSAANGPKRH